MVCRFIKSVTVSAVLVAGMAPARADVIDLNPIRDNTIFAVASNDPTIQRSNGQGAKLLVGRTGSGGGFTLQRALLQFDLSSIPAGATINSVTLTLQDTDAASSGPASVFVEVHRVTTGPWGEGASIASSGSAPSQTGDASWFYTQWDGTTSAPAWTTAGGDFVTAASATLAVSSPNPYSWSSAGLLADVQSWLSNPATNFGWLLKETDEVTTTTGRAFGSLQGVVEPQLIIDFTPVPEPAAALAAAVIGAAAWMRFGRRTAAAPETVTP